MLSEHQWNDTHGDGNQHRNVVNTGIFLPIPRFYKPIYTFPYNHLIISGIISKSISSLTDIVLNSFSLTYSIES